MSTLSLALSPIIKALWRLVRALFGASRAGDVEDGTLVVSVKMPDPVPTFKPDISGIPALVLASMAVGAAFAPDAPIGVKTLHYDTAPVIPIIIVTPPPMEEFQVSKESEATLAYSKTARTARVPLRSIINTVPRVHGKTPRKTRAMAKENVRELPNVPRLCHRRLVDPAPVLSSMTNAEPASLEWENQKVVELKKAREWSEIVKTRHQSLPARIHIDVAEPGTHKWESEKVVQLRQAREWSEAVKARRRSLPTPTHQTVPFLAQANHRALEEISLKLGNTDHQLLSSTAMSSASSGSISSILEAYETDLASPTWLRLCQFGQRCEVQNYTSAIGSEEEQVGRGDGDFKTDEAYGEDHWSEIVSLDDY
ncbi:hypothetical protein K438DRAFT_2143314 [Mycena galopus ATCC 62051]|nr:hypothetical protein K438DRAFT_2143314 [Mycena galopus ATCC 62051]